MPRIDPLQLLKCLSVLLTPEGGILSRDEVPRLVNLMTKFSKKLVSKCVYVLILKSTQTELVDMFMAEGGWTLIQTWLQDAVQTSNWDLVREILGLLLITPVDVERLKLNILPKLIKSLSRREELDGVARLSTQLVQQWLAIVKGSSNALPQRVQVASAPEKVEIAQPEPVNNVPAEKVADAQDKKEDKPVTKEVSEENPSETISTASFYKPSVRDGKLVIRKLASAEDAPDDVATAETANEAASEPQEKDKSKEEAKKTEEKDRDKEKRRSSSSKSSKSSSSKSSSSKDKDRDKDRDKKKSSSSSRSSSSSKSKSSSSSSRDKDRKDRDSSSSRDKDRDKSRSNGSLKSSSSSKSSKDRKDSKERDKDKDKDKQAEKDKDTLTKIKPQTIEKLGRIPKKPSGASPVEDKSKDAKEVKKSFSVGIRKESEERPKTVKVFNSKMRSTGLEEEVKPAPPRPVKKPTPSLQLPTIPPKRPSPPRDHRDPVPPPEKKLKIDKIDVPERPGAIKLIPPKPKPAMLQESDLFMDALTAATAKKEPKKRKRRPSVTKESSSPSSSPARDPSQPSTPTSPPTNGASSNKDAPGSPSLGLKNIAPINFYQDTLSTEENHEETEDNKENGEAENANPSESATEPSEENNEPLASPATPTDNANEEEPVSPKRVKFDGALKGVLLYAKKKGPKKSISWKTEGDLVEIRYFELDETERVNVTKTFGDMAKMEMSSEREAIQMSRKIVGEDTMEAQIMWKLPYLIEQPDPLAVPGNKSLEKDIQFAREKSVLQALYFDKRRIPDSPEEPIPENHQMSDPVLIPLEDPESQEIDLRSTPWPEPKGSPPHVEPQIPPHIFPNLQNTYTPPFNNMPPPQFQGMPPRFGGQGAPGPVGPGNFMPPNLMPNGNMMGPPGMAPPQEMMNQGPMGPNMFPPGPGPDGFRPGPDFPMFGNQNPPNNMNMFPPNNFNPHRPANRGFRRGGGGGGNWVRMSGPNNNNWKRGGGGGHRGGRLCKNIQNHGYCRNGDNCPFVHP